MNHDARKFAQQQLKSVTVQDLTRIIGGLYADDEKYSPGRDDQYDDKKKGKDKGYVYGG